MFLLFAYKVLYDVLGSVVPKKGHKMELNWNSQWKVAKSTSANIRKNSLRTTSG